MSVPIEQMEEEMEPEVQTMTDDELVSKCMDEIHRGIGGTQHGSSGNEHIKTSLDYYFGRAPGLKGSKAKDPHASTFVSQDVMDGVEATVAEIMPTFTTDTIAFYEPDDERDEDAARQETSLVNYLFMEEYDGYTLLQTALKDALLNRNCTVKAYWDERAYVEYETHEDIPEMAVQMVLQPNEENQTVEVVHQEVTEMGDLSGMMEVQAAQQMIPQEVMQVAGQNPEVQQAAQEAMMAAQDKYTIKIKRTTVKGKPVIESVPPEQTIVASEHDSPYLYDCRFVAHEMLQTQSSLIEQGYDPELVEELPAHAQSIENESRTRRTDAETSDYETSDRSTRLILVYECYPLIDFDGDGIAERRKVVIAGNRLLDNDEWGSVCLVGGVATIVPHKYMGISLFDRLKAIQDAKTPVIRSVIDGTQLSSNPRIGVVTGQVNLDDLLTSRTGGAVRMDNPNSVVELPNPQVPQSSYTMLQYMDSLRSERGGSAVDTANKMQAFTGDGQDIQGRIMSSMELNNAVIARTMGETLIRGIFVQIHNLLREHFPGQMTARVGGKWITSMPSDWKKRTSVSVKIGSSHGERQRQASVLNGIIMLQRELMESGSVLADPAGIYTAVTDSAYLAGVKDPDRYFQDPESDEGKQATQKKEAEQQEMKQKEEMMQAQMIKSQQDLAQAELIKGQADILAQQVKLKNDQLQMEVDALKAGTAQAFDYTKLASEVALKMTELEMQAGRDLNAEVEDNTLESQV